MVSTDTDRDTPDAATVVARHWPYDGPHSPEQLASALDAVSLLVRYAANATRRGADTGLAPEVYRALAGLVNAADTLPELAAHLGYRTRVLGEAADCHHDHYRAAPRRASSAAADACAEEAGNAFGAAEQCAAGLTDALAEARAHLSHLYHADGGERA